MRFLRNTRTRGRHSARSMGVPIFIPNATSGSLSTTLGSITLSSLAFHYTDPALESLTGWWRADYSGDPWVGTASAGSSGSRDLVTQVPTVGVLFPGTPETGSTINSLVPADFDWSESDSLYNNTAIGTVLSATAWTFQALLYVREIHASDPLIYNNDPVACDSLSYWGIHLKTVSGTPKIYAYQWDGAEKSASETISLNTYFLVQAKYDGTDVKIRVNGGSWNTVAAGSIITTIGKFFVGLNSTTTGEGFDGIIAELKVDSTAKSDAVLDNEKSYINARYALNL